MSRLRVLQIGMDPAVIDFSPWPGQSAESLQGRIRRAEDELRDAGFDVSSCLLTQDASAAEASVRDALTTQAYDIVEVGSGLRTSHDYTLVFERVINTIITARPGVRLCFNDSPESTLDAVRRAAAR